MHLYKKDDGYLKINYPSEHDVINIQENDDYNFEKVSNINKSLKIKDINN